ncbi:MAG: hypothetical protein CUN52_02255 [Phototrophicales bacterium]|nr:MAG: hypothetical protein CUN52_02255 [Phototrophicales bacterium]
MKQLILLLGLVMVMVLGVSVSQADAPQVTLANAFFAEQMPAGAGVYIGIRTDDAYIEELDGILAPILAKLNDITAITQPQSNIPQNFSTRQILDMIAQRLVDRDFATTIRPWLGSSMAMAGYWGEYITEKTLIAIDHSNRELAEAFVENLLAPLSPATTAEGNFVIYSANNGMLNIAINDDTVYLASDRALLPINGNPANALSNDINFQKAVGSLSAPNYNILVVGETSNLMQIIDNNRSYTRNMVQSILPNGYTAIGATIVNGVSPTIDIAQVGLPSEIVDLFNTPIDPTFLQNIPANATAVIHGTHLIAPYNALIDLVSAQTGQDLRTQLEQAQTIFGMDVISLLLSGDFAIYFTYKPDAIATVFNQQLDALASNPFGITTLDIESLLDFGYIFEISDRAQAQALINQLADLYVMLGAGNDITISREEIAGGNALNLTLRSANMNDVNMLIGTNDRLLVMGFRENAIAILNGQGGFDSNPFYQNSLRYTLPTMTHYWFVDRNIISSLGGLLGILTPQISMAFASINDMMVTPNPTQAAEQEASVREANRQAIMRAMEFNTALSQFAQLFDNATFSIGTKEGILFVRAVLTLSQ